MKVVYDPDKDILQLSFKSALIQETSQIAPGFILDYDEDGNVVGLELRKASRKVDDLYTMIYSIGSADQNKPQPPLKD